MQTQTDNITKEIEEYEEYDVIQETELDGELKYLQERLKKIRNTKKIVTENVEKLQGTIKEQPCTYQEKLDLLKKIDNLKHEVGIKKENIEHAQRIRHEIDEKVNAEREKVSLNSSSFSTF